MTGPIASVIQTITLSDAPMNPWRSRGEPAKICPNSVLARRCRGEVLSSGERSARATAVF